MAKCPSQAIEENREILLFLHSVLLQLLLALKQVAFISGSAVTAL